MATTLEGEKAATAAKLITAKASHLKRKREKDMLYARKKRENGRRTKESLETQVFELQAEQRLLSCETLRLTGLVRKAIEIEQLLVSYPLHTRQRRSSQLGPIDAVAVSAVRPPSFSQSLAPNLSMLSSSGYLIRPPVGGGIEPPLWTNDSTTSGAVVPSVNRIQSLDNADTSLLAGSRHLAGEVRPGSLLTTGVPVPFRASSLPLEMVRRNEYSALQELAELDRYRRLAQSSRPQLDQLSVLRAILEQRRLSNIP